jgi:hypothetical protein
MKFVLLRNLLFFLVIFSFSGCADWREVLHGFPNPEQWTPEGAPTRRVPGVQESGMLDSRSNLRALRREATPPSAILRHEEAALADDLVIHVLNTKAGSCQIVECPHSHRVIVVDCGSSGASGDDLTGDEIAEYFQANAIFSHPDTEVLVTVSHPDQDHTNQIPTLRRAGSAIYLAGWELFRVYRPHWKIFR